MAFRPCLNEDPCVFISYYTLVASKVAEGAEAGTIRVRNSYKLQGLNRALKPTAPSQGDDSNVSKQQI